MSYEKVWNLTSELCAKLYPYIKMGIELKHIEAWVYPNIPVKWDIEKTSIKKLKEFIESDIELKQKKSRLMGVIGNIKEETSFEMLNKGLITLVGNENLEKLGLTEDLFKNWRHSRGDLSHAEKESKITENSLIKRYASLKQFCNNLIDVILEKNGF